MKAIVHMFCLLWTLQCPSFHGFVTWHWYCNRWCYPQDTSTDSFKKPSYPFFREYTPVQKSKRKILSKSETLKSYIYVKYTRKGICNWFCYTVTVWFPTIVTIINDYHTPHNIAWAWVVQSHPCMCTALYSCNISSLHLPSSLNDIKRACDGSLLQSKITFKITR